MRNKKRILVIYNLVNKVTKLKASKKILFRYRLKSSRNLNIDDKDIKNKAL